MPTIGKQEREILQQINTLQQTLEATRKRRTLKCPMCQKRSLLSKWIVVDRESYVPPRGCTDGDYYTHSEYVIHCPKCHEWGRVWDSNSAQVMKEFHKWIGVNRRYFGESLTCTENEPLDLDLLRKVNADRKAYWDSLRHIDF